MASKFKYHQTSGHVTLKLIVSDERNLEPHIEEGFAFIDTEGEDFGAVWIKDQLTREPREKLDHPDQDVTLGEGEAFEVRNLPEDVWISIDGHTPIALPDGELTFTKQTAGRHVVQVVGKYFGPTWHIEWKDLSDVRDKYCSMIDAEAERLRSLSTTDGTGQAVTYLRKADAARLYIAGQPISDSQLQRIEDEAARLGLTTMQAAESLVAVADAWESRDAAIDKARLDGKALIATATSGDAALAIYEGIDWPE